VTLNTLFSPICLISISVLVVCLEALPATAEAAGSALGLEPGARRLCNDDLGVILWGPDAAPTLSVGKSDVWDRRNAQPTEPVLTLRQMMDRAKRAGDSTILNGAAYYTGYNSHDFPCPKPVGQLILQLNFLKPEGKLTVDQQLRQVCLTATKGVEARPPRVCERRAQPDCHHRRRNRT
jgi:hypothetical protein